MSYKTTDRANEDIYSIFLHGLDHFGPEQAEKYGVGLIGAFERLSAHPFMARERRELDPAFRVHFYREHAIFYLVEGDDILIVRVLHGSQDWSRHL